MRVSSRIASSLSIYPSIARFPRQPIVAGRPIVRCNGMHSTGNVIISRRPRKRNPPLRSLPALNVPPKQRLSEVPLTRTYATRSAVANARAHALRGRLYTVRVHHERQKRASRYDRAGTMRFRLRRCAKTGSGNGEDFITDTGK